MIRPKSVVPVNKKKRPVDDDDDDDEEIDLELERYGRMSAGLLWNNFCAPHEHRSLALNLVFAYYMRARSSNFRTH